MCVQIYFAEHFMLVYNIFMDCFGQLWCKSWLMNVELTLQ